MTTTLRSHPALRAFVIGVAAFTGASLKSSAIVNSGILPSISSPGVAQALDALFFVLQVSPWTIFLSFSSWGAPYNEIVYIAVHSGGWILTAISSGALFAVCVRAVGRKWGYVGALLLVIIALLPVVCLVAGLSDPALP
jgi:hypothetical protein